MKRILPIIVIFGGLLLSFTILESSLNSVAAPGSLSWPLENGQAREKKLTFGLFVTPDPENNPIDPPERFTGYHSALDIEIFEDEHVKDVPVYAACEGKVLLAQEAEGYGGVLVQSCRLNQKAVTVLYGHLDFNTFKVKVGDTVRVKDQIGVLGAEKSEESGFNRKHLHFSVHEGDEIALLGYVQTKQQLKGYIDPLPLLESN